MKRTQSRLATVVRLDDERRHPKPPSLELADGAVARVVDGGLELRDGDGRLLVRYVDGTAEISAPSRDLVLSAPSGRVVVRSALDVELEAARDIVHRAARNVSIAAGVGAPQLSVDPRTTTVTSERVHVEATEASVAVAAISTVARKIATKAESIALTADKYELAASRIVEKSRDVFRDVADLAQTRVGRARTIVQSIFTLNARRSVLTSTEDTSIDGRKVLLG